MLLLLVLFFPLVVNGGVVGKHVAHVSERLVDPHPPSLTCDDVCVDAFAHIDAAYVSSSSPSSDCASPTEDRICKPAISPGPTNSDWNTSLLLGTTIDQLPPEVQCAEAHLNEALSKTWFWECSSSTSSSSSTLSNPTVLCGTPWAVVHVHTTNATDEITIGGRWGRIFATGNGVVNVVDNKAVEWCGGELWNSDEHSDPPMPPCEVSEEDE